ncbi:putative aminotransferase family protein [Xylaria nigripes]|nr:putative aminotransferase family protein [Xylaria nigripes]
MTSSRSTVPFGRPMREAHFGFSPDYIPVNHGSYGTSPVAVRKVRTALQAEVEEAPDRFIMIDWPARLKESRALAANMLHCATEDLVFAPNATTGNETILKNQHWNPGDVILAYELVYNAVHASLTWLEETTPVRVEIVSIAFPVTDNALVEAMVSATRRVNASGTERVRLAIVDTIISMPGLRVPFERLVPALQAEGALVLVDAAHGIGHIEIDIGALDPDFLVSNPHKWLFVPRSAAVMYVARRHQGQFRVTVPTSARLRKRMDGELNENAFSYLFDFVAALDFRNQVCGGEEEIRTYSQQVAREGAKAAVSILGTEVMDLADSCMRDCNFANVRLPLTIVEDESSSATNGAIPALHGERVCSWIKTVGATELGCYLQTCYYRGALWWRLSGMVYLEVEDFRKAAWALKGLCERVARGEYSSS